MDEFLCCIDYNQNNEILTGSNYYTYQTWDGYLTCFNDAEFIQDFLVLNPYGKNRQKINTNICDVCWLNDKNAIVATDDGALQLFEYTQQFECHFYKREHDDRINCVCVDKRGETVVTASQDNCIKVWDIKCELSSVHTYRCHRAGVVACEYSPFNSQMFISCSQDTTALLWDLKKAKPAFKLNLNELKGGYPSSVAWSNVDQNLFAIGHEYGLCSLFDTRNLSTSICDTQLHSRLIRKVLINNRLLATCSEDTVVRVNKLNDGTSPAQQLNEVYKFDGHNDYVVDGLWNPNKNYELITCSWDGVIKKHDLSGFA